MCLHQKKKEHVKYVYDMLSPDLLGAEAERRFQAFVEAALETKLPQINDAFHSFSIKRGGFAPPK